MADRIAGMARAMRGGWTRASWMRSATLALTAAMAIGLAGCGGGVELSSDGFSIAVTVDGRSSGSPIGYGGRQDISIWAGESIAFNASEPVVWTLYVGGVAVPADGSTAFYSGASIRATAVSRSRIVIDTAAPAPLSRAVPFTLIARSTYDGAVIATINVWAF